MGDPMAYFVDSLYRSDHPNPSEGDMRGETARILVTDLKDGGASDADKVYPQPRIAGQATGSADTYPITLI